MRGLHSVGRVPQAQHERWNPCEKVLNVNNVGNLRLKWSYTTGVVVYSSPAVANGVVYVGSDDDNVYALNAKHRCQALELHHRRRCVFLARRGEWRGLCRLGRLQRVRAERQDRRQAVELRHRRLCGFLARRGQWGGLCRVGDDNVYALNANTGAKLWSYNTGKRLVFLARRGEWGGLCQLGRLQRVRAECQHRRQAVELHHRRLCAIPRPLWRMGSFMSARLMPTCTR